jgi:hypothetical protein
MLLRKEGSPYFKVLKNKYEDDDNEEFSLLIRIVFVKIPTIIFKVLNV